MEEPFSLRSTSSDNFATVPESGDNVYGKADDMSMFDSSTGSKKVFEFEKTADEVGIDSPPTMARRFNARTPPPPQQGLRLLNKAPRIGLSKFQQVTTLHPQKKS